MSKCSKNKKKDNRPLSKKEFEEIANKVGLPIEQIESLEQVINYILAQRDNKGFEEKLESQLKKIRPLTSFGLGYLISLAFCGSDYVAPVIKDAKNSIESFLQFVDTGLEGIQGSSAQKAARTLYDSIIEVEKAAQENRDGAEALERYKKSTINLIEELLNVHAQNETLVATSRTLTVQLKQSLKFLFEIGNDIKPDFWYEHVDKPIIAIYGKIRETFDKEYQNLTTEEKLQKALEDSKELKEFYTQTKQFYEQVEKNQKTIEEFCNYLTKIETSSSEANKKIEEFFPDILKILKEGYTIERYIQETDKKGIGMNQEDLESLAATAEEYIGASKELNTEIGYVAPITIKNNPHFTDYILNPYVIAFATIVAYKGLMNTVVPFGKKIDSIISRIISYLPEKLITGIANYFHNRKIRKEENVNKTDINE
ncbi:MAG TPA: hypothetical protein PLX15_05535 [Candidatus Woesearchaeota archaeon]|nr:hypothetical protein [Candidatus Woesearchaeota archaeon]